MRQGWHRTDYTDTFVFVGASQREAEQDYRDVRRKWPEMFLGYAVLVISVENYRAVEGLRVSDYFITNRAHRLRPRQAGLMNGFLWRSRLVTRPSK